MANDCDIRVERMEMVSAVSACFTSEKKQVLYYMVRCRCYFGAIDRSQLLEMVLTL